MRSGRGAVSRKMFQDRPKDVSKQEILNRINGVPLSEKRVELPPQMWSSPPILVFSGAHFEATGGGQRPSKLARELARLGHNVIHMAPGDHTNKWIDGVFVIAWEDFDEVFEATPPGVAIWCLPFRVDRVRFLKERGWHIWYDLLDDWTGYTIRNNLDPEMPQWEEEIRDLCEVCTCSAPTLVERARSIGFPEPTLVLNGGPNDILPRTVAPAGVARGKTRVVYIGHTSASWFDWDLVEEIAAEPMIALTIIGEVDGRTRHEHPNVTFLGEIEHDEAMRYVASCHVGIIPFCDAEVCHGVDAIKAYDYWAAGMWCVCTDCMTPMVGRQFTLASSREDFIGNIYLAAEKRFYDQPTRRFVEENSWASRAAQFDAIICGLLDEPEPARVKVLHNVGDRWNLRVTAYVPAHCNMRKHAGPCPYCNDPDMQDRESRMCRPYQEWLEGLTWLSNEFGPLYIGIIYGEPLMNGDDEPDREMIDMIGELAIGNRIDVVTNLTIDLDELSCLPRGGNIRFCTSFHPHAWDRDIEPFLEKRHRIVEMGYDVSPVMIVAFPPNEDEIPGWIEKIVADGSEYELIPYQGHVGKKIYPKDYTDEQLQPIYENMDDLWGRHDLLFSSTKGMKCDAGRRYVRIRWDGTVWGCYSMYSRKLGSLWNRDVTLMRDPSVCLEDCCQCGSLWEFVRDDG